MFRKSVANTLVYLVLVTGGSITLGLSLALLIESDRSGRGFYRTAFFMPAASTLITMAFVWEFLLHPSAGLVNHLLQQVGVAPQNWLNDRHLALYSLAAIGIWQMSGLALVFFLAGLQSIPKSLIEAASMDGARPWRRFWTIQFPLLSPTTFFLLVINVVYAFFDTFAIIDATTQGGPGKDTAILVYKVYYDGFKALDMGSSAAQSVVLMVIVVSLTVLQFKFVEKKVQY